VRKGLLILMAFITLICGCAKKEPVKEKVFPVKVMELKPKTVSSTIVLAGTVDSKAHAWVNSTIEGIVESLTVAEGSQVSSGQILCYIMSVEHQNLLGQAQADYEEAKKEYENAVDEEKAVFLKKLEAAETRLNTAKNLYKPVPVVSPIDGTVIAKNVEVGNTVSTKQPIIEIADTKQLIVKSAVSELYISTIKKGQEVKVKLHSLKDAILPARVSVITPGIRLETRTADIEVALAPDERIRPGMTASLEVIAEKKDNVLAVPQDALIIKPNGEKFVFIAENDTAKMVKITTGIESNTEIEVTSGLKPNEKVIVLGQDILKDGVKVKISEVGK